MSKKVAFGAKPSGAAAPDADKWVDSRALPSADPKADVPMKRMTFEIPADLHRRFKAGCAVRGVNMADELRRFIEAEYSEAKPIA